MQSSHAASPTRESGSGLAGAWTVWLPVLLLLPVVLAPPVNQDVAAVLAFTQRWLGGSDSSDLIDVNPPLIFLLNLAPAGLARMAGLNAVVALRSCMFAYGMLCWLLARRMRDRVVEGAVERGFLDVLPALFLVGAGYDFAQREQLMAMAALPYVLCAARRAAGAWPRGWLAVTVLAAAAFALKPHFLAIPALVEAGVLAVRWAAPLRMSSSWMGRGPAGRVMLLGDPVPWVLAGVWLAYLSSLPLLFSDYFVVVLPLVWDYYVGLGGLSAGRMLLVPGITTALTLLLPGLWLGYRSPDLASRGALPRLFGLAGLGALAAAMAQHKGWSYHYLPLTLFACGLAGLLAASRLDRSQADARLSGLLAGLYVLYLIANGDSPWRQLAFPGSEADALAQLLQREAAGEHVLVLSPDIYPVYPALNYADATATLRTMSMWLLQSAYPTCLPDGRRYRDVQEMGRTEFFVYRTVAEDFARTPPAAVVVDRNAGIPWCGEAFSFISYFSRHPLFAEVWSHYRLTGEWNRFQVYTRQD